MTRKRRDNHGTQFGSWIREQKRVDSDLGYITTDLDFVWHNYQTGNFMLIEEKRRKTSMTLPQTSIHRMLNSICLGHKHYYGFHLLQFEKTSPEDGAIFWNGYKITKDKLLTILEMDTPMPGYFELAHHNKLGTQPDRMKSYDAKLWREYLQSKQTL